MPGCPRSRPYDLGMPCPLPFFFGSFEFSVVSSVGFLFRQPVGGGHACSQYRHCLPSMGQALTLDASPPWARMGALGGLFELFWACRRPWTGQLCSWRPRARGWQGQVFAHTAQACPGPSPVLLRRRCGVWNATGVCSPAGSALTHILVWRESSVDTTHSSSLGSEGMGMRK